MTHRRFQRTVRTGSTKPLEATQHSQSTRAVQMQPLRHSRAPSSQVRHVRPLLARGRSRTSLHAVSACYTSPANGSLLRPLAGQHSQPSAPATITKRERSLLGSGAQAPTGSSLLGLVVLGFSRVHLAPALKLPSSAAKLQEGPPRQPCCSMSPPQQIGASGEARQRRRWRPRHTSHSVAILVTPPNNIF